MPSEEQNTDVVLLHSPTDDGSGVRVLRARHGNVEMGEVRPVTCGKPITSGEVVTLRPREGAPRVCDVEVQYEAKPAATLPAKTGPAQVATEAYRDNWETTFGRKPHATLN